MHHGFSILQVAAKQMVGVYLSVWVRRGVLPHVRGVQVTSIGTGMMGYLGNKGVDTCHCSSVFSALCSSPLLVPKYYRRC